MQPRVLLVDDDADFRMLLEYTLARQGFEVFTAPNGLEALNRVRHLLPDVVLLDLRLPDLDGFSVCEIMRSQPSTRKVPVIIISAIDGQSVEARIGALGALCFFRKPVDLRSLGEHIRTAVQQQEAARARLTERDDRGEDGPVAASNSKRFYS